MKALKNAMGRGTATNTAATTSGAATGTSLAPASTGLGEIKEGETVVRGVDSYGAAQQPFMQQPMMQSQVITSAIQPVAIQTTDVVPLPIQKQVAAPMISHREAAPVIHERYRREEVEEIQPIIHRERERTEVHKITQPIHTSSVLGVVAEEAVLPAQMRPEIRTPGMIAPAAPIGSREAISGQRLRVEKPAMVVETEKRNVIEEIQPVIYREVVEPHVIRLTQPIYERIVEGEVYFTQTMPAQISSAFSQGIGAQQYGLGQQYYSGFGQQQFGGLGAQQYGLGQQYSSGGLGQQQYGLGSQQFGNQQFQGQQLGSQQFGGQQGLYGGQQLGNQQFGGQQFGSQQGLYDQGLGSQQFGQQGLASSSLGGQQYGQQGLASGLGAQQPNWGAQQGLGGMGAQQSSLGAQQGLGAQQSGYGAQQGLGGLGAQQSGLGAQQGLGGLGAQPGLGQQSFGSQLGQGLSNQASGMINQGISAITPSSFKGAATSAPSTSSLA